MSSTNKPWSRDTLPRPFSSGPWRGARQEAADAFWDWHQALTSDARDLEDRRSAALAACEQFDLDGADVLRQEEAANTFRSGFRIADAEGLDAFVDGWTGAHGRLIATLAGTGRYEWQRTYVHAMARGFYLTAALMVLPEDLNRDRIPFPLEDLRQVGVSESELKSGRVVPRVKKLLWREVIRARDSFAQAQPLIDDLGRREAAAFRRWWFAGLETLRAIESADFDVWSRPPHLSRYRRLHARFQARFGRTTFR